jgi:putative transcriptional regulator
MTKIVVAKSRLMEAMHDTAADLHRLGFIDKRKMQRYEALCLAPVPKFDSERVKALREKLNLSQAVLASVLNTSLSTVRKWEGNEKHPSGPSSKLLDLLERKGLEVVL